MNKCRPTQIPPILNEGTFPLNCIDEAKLFNEHFSNKCKLILNNSSLPVFEYITDKRIESVSIKDEDILFLIRKLNPNKAAGSDGISGQMLLIADSFAVLPLRLFHNILETSLYPNMWKLANVTPFFKKDDKQLVKNNQPISLHPICGNLFKKMILTSLYSYLNNNSLITQNQSGFRPGDSTTNQLLFLVNEIHKVFENPKSLEVRAVFLDISKAFDKVWHQRLLFKLKQNGISGKLLNLFESYLHNRKQGVALNGTRSVHFYFLSILMICKKHIKSNANFFADDTMLFSVIKDPQLSASDLNHDLEVINQWAYQWKMAFNPVPTKQATEILFSCKKKK